MSKKIIYISLVSVVTLAIFWRIIVFDSTAVEPVVVPIESSQETTDAEENIDNTKAEQNQDTPKKESNQSVNNDDISVDMRPIVATGYGNSPTKPLPSGQETSTTCTTDPNVECVVILSSGNQTIMFDSMTTDSQGVAIWNWVGGSDVPSGTWEISATAGNKTSVTGVIYVE